METSVIFNFIIRLYNMVRAYFKESISFRFLKCLAKKSADWASGSRILYFIAKPERANSWWHSSMSFGLSQKVLELIDSLLSRFRNIFDKRSSFFSLKHYNFKTSRGVVLFNFIITCVFMAFLVNLSLLLYVGNYSNQAVITRAIVLIVLALLASVKIDLEQTIYSSKIVPVFIGVVKWIYAER